MKNRIGASAIGVCLMSASLLVFSGSAVAAAKVDATLRVVNGNKVLVDQQFSTGTTAIKTSSKENCLGSGSKNGTVTLTGPTALGILGQASTSVSSLRPLGIMSDTSGYGEGLCTIGGVTAPSTGFWSLKVNHKASSTGGSSTVLKNGDIVLWYLNKDFNKPSPGELFLKAPLKARKNKNIKATVFSYDDAGKKSVVKGAKLSGTNAAATNAKGVTTLKLKKSTSLSARLSGSLPSNRVKVTVKG